MNFKAYIYSCVIACSVVSVVVVSKIVRATQSWTSRKVGHPINSLILNRWSPRAMSGEKITQEELMSLFEAARWAPSSFNNQPWRFIYALRGTDAWNTLFDLMVPFNQSWAKDAGALVVIVSHDLFSHNDEFCRTHSFDTGAAWQNMALQGSAQGLVVHGMAGFDYDRAKTALNIPENYTVEAMIAIGRPADKKVLPEALQEREYPSERNSIETFAFEGQFKR